MSQSGRIPSLDGLRAASMLCVVVDHLGLGPNGLGAFGVQSFFVISGFLITSLLQDEHLRSGSISLKAFYTRRAFRILPAALTYMLVIGLLFPQARHDLLYAVTYTACYHMRPSSEVLFHLWSLSVEEQFYLFWPLALVICFRHRAKVATAAVVAAIGFRLWCATAAPQFMAKWLHFSFPGVADSIAVGCLMAVYEPQLRHLCSKASRNWLVAVCAPICSLAVACALWKGTFPYETVRHRPYIAGLWTVIPAMIALTIMLLIVRKDRILNNSVASALGAISYSVYLWQQPFLNASPDDAPIKLLIVFSLGALSYLIIERPLQRVGVLLARTYARPTDTPPPDAAAAMVIVNALSAEP